MTDRKTCLVTGASAGIGAARALRAAPDRDLLPTCRSEAQGAEDIAKAARAKGETLHVLQPDAAALALWLRSDEARHITGTSIDIPGGR